MSQNTADNTPIFSNEEPTSRSGIAQSIKWLIGITGGIVVLTIYLANTLVFIQFGELGVVISPYEQRGIRSEPLSPGYHLLKPGEKVHIDNIVNSYDSRQRTYEISGDHGDETGHIEATTLDGQTIQMHLIVAYAINSDEAAELYNKWRGTYQDGVVKPMSRGITRETLARYPLEKILHDRAEVEKEIFGNYSV